MVATWQQEVSSMKATWLPSGLTWFPNTSPGGAPKIDDTAPPVAATRESVELRSKTIVDPSGVKLGSTSQLKHGAVVTWVKPPPVIGMVAIPVVLTKATVRPSAVTPRWSTTTVPHAADVQMSESTPVVGSTTCRLSSLKLTKTTGPLDPGNVA